MKKFFLVFGVSITVCVLWALLLVAASGPPPIVRNVFTTNTFPPDPPVTVINTIANPVIIVGTNADGSITVTQGTAPWLTLGTNTIDGIADAVMAKLTNVSATVVNTIGTNADGSITVRAQESTNRVTQGTTPWVVSQTSPSDWTAFTSAWITNYLVTNGISKLVSAECYNGSTTNWFMFTITDTASLASGTFARHQFWIAPTNTIVWSPPAPEAFTNGILLGISTTPSTNTFATNLVGSFTATWRP